MITNFGNPKPGDAPAPDVATDMTTDIETDIAAGFGATESHNTYLQMETFLPSVIRNLAEEITSRMSQNYTGDFQLTITEWRILLQLAAKQSLTATDIVDITAMEKSKVSMVSSGGNTLIKAMPCLARR